MGMMLAINIKLGGIELNLSIHDLEGRLDAFMTGREESREKRGYI